MQTRLALAGIEVTQAEQAFIEAKYDGAITEQVVRDTLAALRAARVAPCFQFQTYSEAQLHHMLRVEGECFRVRRSAFRKALQRRLELRGADLTPRTLSHVRAAQANAECGALHCLNARREIRLIRQVMIAREALPMAAE